jgi:NitT/TauT family transport system ATP-binding protein
VAPDPFPIGRRGPDVSSLVLRGVTKRFDGRGASGLEALGGIDLEVPAGQFVALIGPSGSGKSTLLKAVAGLIEIDGGQIAVAGTSPDEARRDLAFALVPQSPALLPWQSVWRNAALLGEITGRADRARVRDLLEAVGLGEHLDLLPHQLSGGMQQRVALVRAFALGAPVLLMDEPFAALDELTRDDLRYQLLELWSRTGATVLFVTHSIDEAVVLADRVVVLSPRPGRVVADVAVPIPRPRHPDVEDTEQFHQVVTVVRHALRNQPR